MPLVRVGMNDALPTVLPAIDKLLLWLRHERHTIKESAQKAEACPRRSRSRRGRQSIASCPDLRHNFGGPPDTPKQPGRHRPMARHTKRHDLSAAALTALPEIVACLCLERASERGMAADATDYRPTAS